MGTYDKDAATMPSRRLDGEDNQRTRLSNDYVRDAYKRREWFWSLLRIIVGMGSLAAAITEVIHYMTK